MAKPTTTKKPHIRNAIVDAVGEELLEHAAGDGLDRRKHALARVVTLVVGAGLSLACGSSSSKGSQNGDAGANDATSSSSSGGGSGSGSGSGGSSGSSSGSESGAQPPSCAPGGPGMTNCGANSESCCASLEVPGGTYFRSYDPEVYSSDAGTYVVSLAADGGPTDLADPATLSGFRLDKYLVTVGRFRQFVNAWDGGAGWIPSAGSGKHTHLNGGQGLANSSAPGTYETGWVASDDSSIAPTNANLACYSVYDTWTNTAGSQENLPINCVTWGEAYAFCIWDGGFLPTEAEWEYAAAGGGQQREYPWGSTDPGTGTQYASNYNEFAPVGAATLGAGLWGQLDLDGEVAEWNLDWFAPSYVDPCADCAYMTAGSNLRVFRGGGVVNILSSLLSATRNDWAPASRYYGIGLRCSRAP